MEQEAVPGMPETFPDVMVEVPKILRETGSVCYEKDMERKRLT